MISYLRGYLDEDWKTKEQILYFLNQVCRLNISERSFRQYVAEFNEMYESGETEYFIAHSNKGYLLTNDRMMILNSLADDAKRAFKLLKRYYRCKKALSEKNQLSLTQRETDIYEIVMGMRL